MSAQVGKWELDAANAEIARLRAENEKLAAEVYRRGECAASLTIERDALSAEVGRWKDKYDTLLMVFVEDEAIAARDRVIEAAFEALNAWSGIVSYTSCGHLTAVARRLRAELEGT